MSKDLRQERDRMREEADRLAHNTMGAAPAEREFLIAAGRYRALCDSANKIDERLRRAREPDGIEHEDDDDLVDEANIRRQQFKHRPRPWGGGK